MQSMNVTLYVSTPKHIIQGTNTLSRATVIAAVCCLPTEYFEVTLY